MSNGTTLEKADASTGTECITFTDGVTDLTLDFTEDLTVEKFLELAGGAPLGEGQTAVLNGRRLEPDDVLPKGAVVTTGLLVKNG